MRRARALLVAFVLLAGCALKEAPERPLDAEEEDTDEQAQPAVTYTELRLTPRGTSSGLERDLEPMRERSADDETFFAEAAENIDLDRRAELRSFEGAPPVIPHAVAQDSAPECLACHGARLEFRGRPARPICHDEHTNCTACHVMSAGPMPGGADLPDDARAVVNTFVGLRRQVENPTPTEPPPIPHRTQMRERCASCHGQNGPGGGHHPVDFEPERKLPDTFTLASNGHLTCRTCHEPSRELATFAGGATAADYKLPKGSELCLSCHQDAHAPVFERLGLSGGGHPGGRDLDKILSQRMGSTVTTSGCLGCHGTNGALQKAEFRDAGEGRVCAVCHRTQADTRHGHPVGSPAQAGKTLPADLPVGENGAPICQSCHDLQHGDRDDHLLRHLAGGKSLCMSCHQDREEAMKGAHGKAGAGRAEPCFGCHQVHDADKSKHLLATGNHASAGDPFGCLACHGPGGSAASHDAHPGTQGHPVDGRAHPDVEGALTCVSCHDAHAPDPKTIVCGSCHRDKAADFARGGHATAKCLDCHPTHKDAAVASVPNVNPSAERCLACHDAKVGKSGIKHVSDYLHPVPVFTPGGLRWEPLGTLPLYGPNGNPVPSNANGDLTCSTCHTTHGPDPTHPADHLRRPGWMGVCSACHGDDSLLVYKYFHDRAQLKEKAP